MTYSNDYNQHRLYGSSSSVYQHAIKPGSGYANIASDKLHTSADCLPTPVAWELEVIEDC